MKAILFTLPLTVAWPGVMMMMNTKLQVRGLEFNKRDPSPGIQPPFRKALFESGRPNTGAAHNPPAPFVAADQFVDVRPGSGHEWIAPKKTDKRGECPGLNAAANHGFLPRNGLPTILDTILGLGEAYNMSPDLAAFLALVSVALSGDPVTQTWSIGGAFPSTLGLPAGGILSLHSKYEGDASIIRGDAYLNGGNVGIFQDHKWDFFMKLDEPFTLDKAAAQSDYNTRYSILNNPYYFSGPFSGLVAPAAHDFVINFMSNHSAAAPGGVLTREVLQSFFAVTGTKTDYKHNPGLEKIPLNWYKRPTSQQYNAADVFADLLVNNAMYPGSLRVGGNTGTTNSFAGVVLGDFTDGLFHLKDLAKGNNGICFLFQAVMAGLPDSATPIAGLGESLYDWMIAEFPKYVGSKLECPQLAKVDYNSVFQKYPGYSYKATGSNSVY